jgi:hypothetical protein
VAGRPRAIFIATPTPARGHESAVRSIVPSISTPNHHAVMESIESFCCSSSLINLVMTSKSSLLDAMMSELLRESASLNPNFSIRWAPDLAARLVEIAATGGQ